MPPEGSLDPHSYCHVLTLKTSHNLGFGPQICSSWFRFRVAPFWGGPPGVPRPASPPPTPDVHVRLLDSDWTSTRCCGDHEPDALPGMNSLATAARRVTVPMNRVTDAPWLEQRCLTQLMVSSLGACSV